jgi:hypothetical protein
MKYLLTSFAVSLAIVAGIMVWLTSGDEPKATPIAMPPRPQYVDIPGPRPGVQTAPQTTDEKLLAEMRAHNIAVIKPDGAIKNASIVCTNLTNGVAWEVEVNAIVGVTPGYTYADGDEYVRLAVQLYCPQNN